MEVTKYELLIVSKLDQTDGLTSRVEKALKDANASEVKTEKLGKKTLAYPIKKQSEADYIIFRFEALGSSIKDISDMLRLEQEALLRYLITVPRNRKLRRKVTEKPQKVQEVKEEKKPKVTVVTKKVASQSKAVKGAKSTKGKRTSKK